MTQPVDIEALRALLMERATLGPWVVRTLENFGFNIVHYVDGDKFDLIRVGKCGDEADAAIIAAAVNALPFLLTELEALRAERGRTFSRGEHVEKISGSKWRGRVVGYYSTDLTPEGYAVESDTETGSVQIYPAKALRATLKEPSQ